METLKNMEKGTEFTARNINTNKYILCKKTAKDTIYIYTFHDFDGNKMGGYRTGIKSFLEDHELV